MHKINVLKASGELEAYSSKKLRRSLLNAGADDVMANEILAHIEAKLYEGVRTKEIYTKALSLLRRRLKSVAGRYSVKEAIMKLGNTGRPFEVFTGEVFKSLGYDVEIGVVVQGRSITHEMDVIATNIEEQHLIECKYSQLQGKHVSIQVPLYVHSRVNDIAAYRRNHPDFHHLVFSTWVVTNNRFSSDSISYSLTYGLNLLSWDYPHGEGLKDLIKKYKLYPITILTSLTLREKGELIDSDIVTVPQLSLLLEQSDPRLNILEKKLSAVLREVKSLEKQNTI